MADDVPNVVPLVVDYLSFGALIEIEHSLHVARKHVLATFNDGSIDATATKARLQTITDTQTNVTTHWIDGQVKKRESEPF